MSTKMSFPAKNLETQPHNFLTTLSEDQSFAFLKLSTLPGIDGISNAVEFLDDVVIDVNNDLKNKVKVLAFALESLEQGVSLGELISLAEERVSYFKRLAFQDKDGLFEQVKEFAGLTGALPESVMCQIENNGNSTVFEIKNPSIENYLSSHQKQEINGLLYTSSNEDGMDM